MKQDLTQGNVLKNISSKEDIGDLSHRRSKSMIAMQNA